MPHAMAVANGSALRIRYFDCEGRPQTTVMLSTQSVETTRENARHIERSLHAFYDSLGAVVIDITIDLEEREQLLDMKDVPMQGAPPIRGAGFLQLATVAGRNVSGQQRVQVDLLIRDQDDLWQPTNLSELASGI